MHILKGVCLESVQSLDDCLIQRQPQALKDFFRVNITNSGIERLFVQSQSVMSKRSLKPDCLEFLKTVQTVCLKATQAMCLEAITYKKNVTLKSIQSLNVCVVQRQRRLWASFSLESMHLVKEIKLVQNFNICVIYRQCRN